MMITSKVYVGETAKQELQVSIHSSALEIGETTESSAIQRCLLKLSWILLSGQPQINISIDISSRLLLKDDTSESPSLSCNAIAKARARF